MRVKESKIINTKVTQIYLTEDENKDKEIQEQINKIKSSNSNVILFVSGNKEVKETLKEMVSTMKCISTDMC